VARGKRGRVFFLSASKHESRASVLIRSEPKLQVQTGGQARQKGTVKWFNPTKGYGFIKPAVGQKDVFVHISAVERAGLSTLNENQHIEYDLVENRGKASAENLKVT
jgi:cold shock protein